MELGGAAIGNVVEIIGAPMAYRAATQLRENIRDMLRIRKEDQKQLAFAMGRHPTTLNKFLMGTREIQLADLDKIADYFGVTVAELFQADLLKERRSGRDRRSGKDRRIGHQGREMQFILAGLAKGQRSTRAAPLAREEFCSEADREDHHPPTGAKTKRPA